MIRLLRYLSLGFHFVFGTLAGILIGLARPFDPTNSRRCAQLYGLFGLPIIGLKVKVTGTRNFPADRAFVAIANHQSNWDLFVVGQAVPERTVSVGKKSLKWIPLFGQLYWLAGNILVDRSNHKKAMEAMESTKRALREQQTNMWFFAEGTRNHGKNMLPFKKGAFLTALHAGAPIVPVCVGPYLDGFSLDRRDNGTVEIKILPAIETSDLNEADVAELMQACHDTMLREITALGGKLDKQPAR